MTTYQQLLEGVAQYYGSGSDQWLKIAQQGVTASTIPIIEQVPGVSITRSLNGKFLGYDYKNPFSSTLNPASVIDSNVQTGAYGLDSFTADLPATAVTDSQTGLTVLESGAKTVSTGTKVLSVANKIATGIMAVSLGSKLGKKISEAAYNLVPDLWDQILPTMNPETWESIATTEAGKTVVRALFGIEDSTQSTTMYLDERMLAYVYMTLLKEGAFSTSGYELDYDDIDRSKLYAPERVTGGFYPGKTALIEQVNLSTGDVQWLKEWELSDDQYVYRIPSTAPETFPDGALIVVSENTTTLITREGSPNNTQTVTTYLNRSTWGGITYYNSLYQLPDTYRLTVPALSPCPNGIIDPFDLAYITFNGTITEIAGMEGVEDNENAGIHITPSNVINPRTQQPVTPADNPDDVLQALKDTYPDLFEDEIYEDIPQEDGTPERHVYIPVPYPDFTEDDDPITDDTPDIDPQVNPEINPDVRPEPELDNFVKTIVDDPEPPVVGEGDTPPVVIPPGTANALYAIYNPTQGELNSFGAWLWSSNFVDQLLKLFNDPMQAIIGLHKVFAQPSISGVSTIKVGYLDSGVSSNVVGSQYTTIDCGSVSLREYFGNVFDYSPFTEVSIYLPFIGIVKLNTGDVMRASLHVIYHVDVLTGACLAEIRVTRDSAGGTIYTYSGNAAVQYPISSGSYMGIIASIASIAGGVVGTIGSGGALAPVAMGAFGGILNTHTRVQHSGGFSGNAGAMGAKKPYLIITRPQTALARNFPEYEGYPANHYTSIASCTGYFRVREIHLEGIPATDAELSELEGLLKSGVIK